MQRLPILICAFLLPLAAQDPEPRKASADLASYDSFFQMVLSYQSANQFNLMLNGESVSRKPAPKLQEVIGLTDSEVETLRSTAKSYANKVRQAMPQAQGMVFELRIQMIDSGTAPPALVEVERKVDQDHDNIVIDHIQQLMTAYGEVRFKVLDDYVRSGKARKDLVLVIDKPAEK